MAGAVNFFLGANSGDGVRSLMGRLAREELYDLILLKSGPGGGKSTFLSALGAALEDAGAEVEYLRCAGDPESLDGVVAPGLRCAAVDATAPHVGVTKSTNTLL